MMTSEPFYKKYEHLFDGWPNVDALELTENDGMRVAGWHNTPAKLKMADTLAAIWALCWAGMIVFNIYEWHRSDHIPLLLWSGIGFGIWAAMSLVGYYLAVSYAGKLTTVFLSPNRIIFGDKGYDGRVQHKFTMDIHRKAKEEADAELRAQQRDPKRADARKRKYYRDAYHIYFEYLGQRRLVADISKEEDAEKFLRALNAVDRIMQNEKSVYAANSNVEEPTEPRAQGRYKGHFGQRPALD